MEHPNLLFCETTLFSGVIGGMKKYFFVFSADHK